MVAGMTVLKLKNVFAANAARCMYHGEVPAGAQDADLRVVQRLEDAHVRHDVGVARGDISGSHPSHDSEAQLGARIEPGPSGPPKDEEWVAEPGW